MSNGRKLADLMVGTNVVVSNVDSDLSTKISSIKTRLDSDDAKLQSLDTAVQAGIVNLVDSDLIINQLTGKITAVVSNVDSDSAFIQSIKTKIKSLKTRLDSDDSKLQTIRTGIAAEIAATNTDLNLIKGRLDSDDAKLQSLDTSLTLVKARLDSDDSAIQAATTLALATAGAVGVTDSDLKVVADLRNNLDSEIASAKNLVITYTNFLYNATAGQTTFTGSAVGGATLAYTAGTIQVFLNGIRLEAYDYIATDGTSVVLFDAAQLGHQVTIIVPTLSSNYSPVAAGPNWPGLSQQAKLTASDASSNDFFGRSVDVKGDYAVVGARAGGGRGQAYVFYRSGTTWTQQSILQPGTGSNVSISVGMSKDGNYVIVGNPGHGGAGKGAAHVYGRTGTSWSLKATLIDSARASNDEWGIYVSINEDGTYASVGSLGADVSGTDGGIVTIFHRSNPSSETWTQQQRISAPSPESGAGHGWGHLNDAGDYLAVGSGLSDISGSGNAGAVFIYTRSGTTWSYQATLTASDAGGSDYLGYENTKINGDGDIVVAGAYGHNISGLGDAGAVYIWTRSGTTWTQAQKITAPTPGANDHFGEGVDITGDTIVVGEWYLANGKAYVYSKSGSTWSLAKEFTSSDIGTEDYFGRVAIDEDTIIAGSPGKANTSNSAGAAYIFTA